jgi:2-polyprenyl-3-methyl-5-hydroxy-6-metoxy-1,4-benzoquinol methylase
MSSLNNLPNSPVTGNKNVRFIESFSSKHVAELYRDQENLNVEKYFPDNEFHLLECVDTGYRFYFPFEIIGDEEFYKNFHTETLEKTDGYERDWAEDHKVAAGQIEKNERLLEIGCGSGKFLNRISAITKNVAGLELNSLVADSARKKGFDVQNKLIEEYCEENPSAFDIVCAFQVLEHIADVKPFMDCALKLLKPGGKLIFSVPNSEPYFQRFSKYAVLNLPPHHMGLWNISVFKKLEDFYPMDLEKFEYTGERGLIVDAYLRAKLMANIKSLPDRHTGVEKLKTYGYSPFALVKSSLDFLSGKRNRAYLTVAFRRR